MSAGTTLHASCVVVGEAGILIRGAPGSGKSRLARALVERAVRAGGFARLVADDRTRLVRHGSRLVARPVPAIAGLAEMRGLGLVRVAHEKAAVLRLVVDCLPDLPLRHPDPRDRRATVAGLELPRLAVRVSAETAALVEAGLDADVVDDTMMTK